ncbi:MAG: hypothetical protein QM679_04120 [Patulibacter sp.]
MQSAAGPDLQQLRERIVQLSSGLEAWVAGQHAPLRHRHDASAGAHEWRIQAPSDVPAELAQHAAAVLSGLRDHLNAAVRDAADRTGTPPEQLDALRFPVASTLGEFEQLAATGLAGASDALQSAIEQLQPYQLSAAALGANLRVIVRLADAADAGEIDGALVIASGVDPRTIEVSAGQAGASADVTAGYGIGKPADGELALRIVVRPATTPIQVQPFDPPSLVVAFGNADARVSVPDLHNLVATVERACNDLARVGAGTVAVSDVPLTPPSA